MIIPVYNVERYLADCLDSVLAQEATDLEVIVVDDGSTDASPAIIARYAGRDRRVRAFRQAHAGQGPARNRGVAHASGEFLTFVDADDLVPPGAYGAMLATLRRSGSDFVVGAARRVRDDGQRHFPPWHGIVHDRDRIGLTIDEFPSALADVIACNRVFRRSFWTGRIGDFPSGILYEDHEPMVAAYLRAARFDLLARVTYDWRIREDRSSTGQRKHELRNLADRLTVKERAGRLVGAEASGPVRAAWLGRVIDTDLTPYLDHALREGEEYRAMLRDGLRPFVAEALREPDVLAHVRVRQKVRTFLAAQGAWSQLEVAQRFFRDFTSVPPTRVVAGRIVIDEELPRRLSIDLPPQLLELSRHESRLQASALRAEWTGAGSLRLTGWAIIRGVDLEGRSPDIELWLVPSVGDERIDLPVEAVSLPEATRWVDWPHGSFDAAGFRTEIDAAHLARSGEVPAEWSVRVRVRVDGLEREDGLHHAIAGGSASRAAITSRRVSADGTVAVPRHDRERGLTVALRPPGVMADRLDPAFDGRTVRGGLRAMRPQPAGVRARNRANGAEVAGTVSRRTDGGSDFAFRLPDPGGAVGDGAGSAWELRAIDRDGRARAVEWPASEERTRILGNGDPAPMHWQRSPRGYVQLIADRPLVSAVDVVVTDDELAIAASAQSGASDRLRGGCLVGDTASSRVSSVRRDNAHRIVLAVPLDDGSPGSVRALPSGTYRLQVGRAQGHHAELDPGYAASLPVELMSTTHRIRVAVAGQRELEIVLSAPLADDEVSARDQQRLRDGFPSAMPVPEDVMVFQGRGDTLRALHVEVGRRQPDLARVWAVPDRAADHPTDGTPLIIGSRGWYARLASARFLCTDTDLEPFFVKRSHQRMVRVLDADALEQMGRTAWWDEGTTPGQIEEEVTRRTTWWDLVVVPDAASADRCRRELSYAGPMLVEGEVGPDRMVEALLGRG